MPQLGVRGDPGTKMPLQSRTKISCGSKPKGLAVPRIVLIDDLRSFVDGRRAEVARTSAAGILLLARCRDQRLGELWQDHDLGGDDTIWPVVEVLERAAFEERPFDVSNHQHSLCQSGRSGADGAGSPALGLSSQRNVRLGRSRLFGRVFPYGVTGGGAEGRHGFLVVIELPFLHPRCSGAAFAMNGSHARPSWKRWVNLRVDPTPYRHKGASVRKAGGAFSRRWELRNQYRCI